MTRALSLILAALLLAAGPAAAAPRAELSDIEDEVMCPICGTSLALSNAPQAERERALIRRLIAQGRSKQEIKDALVAEYGREVLAVPDTEGFDLAAWLVPGLGILLVAAGLGVGLRRWRRAGGREGQAPPPISPSDAERLDADLARYDL